jgi:hypothetical protein
MGGTFVEVNGNSGGTEFWHKGPMAAKVGVICGLTTMPMVAVVAHTPAVGVKVYTVVPAVVVLMVVFQVPVIGGTFVEVNGNSGGTEFWHKGPMAVKVGVI